MIHPNEPLRCLLIQPRFSDACYWNYVSVCKLVGARAIQPPLGLLTVAALLPKQWEARVVDLNVRSLTEDDWNWADVVCTGGMLPQQKGILEVICAAKARGKYVVVGGPDPTSQAEIYRDADALVLGEGEVTIPRWLTEWSDGRPRGRFESDARPDINTSPIPRFELVDFDDYMHIGVQYSRGCPFNCEFCDIIELYGRVPRTKSTQRLLAELQRLYDLGHRGWVDLVDDNFIGNKRNVKGMLPELETWCRENGYPFYFTTEASMNIADDSELMDMMRRVDFRWVFMGIESPDPALLHAMQKKQNALRPVADRVRTIYEHGIGVAAGFILGFDNEPAEMDRSMIACIEEASIVFALVGLLIACPQTQLTRRLRKEGRLVDMHGRLVPPEADEFFVDAAQLENEHIDTSTTGLNFVTTRDRTQIMQEFANVIRTVYNPGNYFERVLRATQMTRISRRHHPSGRELRRVLRGGWRGLVSLTANPRTRRHFWNVFLRTLFTAPHKLEYAMMAMVFFLHFEQQTAALIAELDQRRERVLAAREAATEVGMHAEFIR